MRIAYFVNRYPAVSHTFIRREILALERQGVEVERFALRWYAPLTDPEDELERTKTRFVLGRGVVGLLPPCLRLALRSPRRFWRGLVETAKLAWGGDRTVLHHLVSLAEAIQLAEWLRERQIRHLHAHFGTNSAEIALLASVVGGVTYSFTVHGSDEWDQPRQYKLMEKVQRASFVVCISQYTRAQLARWSRAEDRRRIHVVHCGLDHTFLQSPTSRVPDNLRVVCVGRLCREKAQGVLVDAVAVLHRRGLPVELVLAGDGETRSKLERRIRDLGLERHVRITGWVSSEEVRRLLVESRVLALPSFMEALPVVLMEAMAMGRPVVTTFVGGIPELVRPGLDGWLVPASAVTELADAIETAMLTPVARLEQMGARAQQRVRLRHDADAEAVKLVTLFEAVSQDGRPVLSLDEAEGAPPQQRQPEPLQSVVAPDAHARNGEPVLAPRP